MPDDNDDELITCSECSNEMSQDDSFTTNNGEIVCWRLYPSTANTARTYTLPMMIGIV
jgi:formylmethanofuran dehydrogenase subunit E